MCLSQLQISSDFKSELLKAHQDSEALRKVLPAVEQGKHWKVSEGQDGLWRFKNRIVVPDVRDLRQNILKEAHKSEFSIRPGSTKMYKDLKAKFWWPWMKNDVAMHVSKCLTCQKRSLFYIKILGNLSAGIWDSVNFGYCVSPSDKWSIRENYSDLGGYAKGLCFGPADELGSIKKIRSRMLIAQSHQKSYAD
ncbi:uncharacterized protein LOC110269280 [Arachis ipaensis]|uniref:uncharacterized protein LOC110269280 n=1 Tax=Arachis ipaensis TaxID=130454 RepID=UPI000A2B10D6|nr:uncharacterized protein LOC110269280 [Arachis ipaensis]